jgi:hypothetical protein
MLKEAEFQMTDAQILAMAITVLAVLAGRIVNNTRLGDVKEVLRAEFQKEIVQLNGGMSLRFSSFETTMNERFNSIDRKLDELIRLQRRSRCAHHKA